MTKESSEMLNTRRPSKPSLISIGHGRERLGVLISLGLLALAAVWSFARVINIRPVILGDEYLYSMNARKIGLWEPSEFGDFSNYLYNAVFSVTNTCGAEFYTCVKGLNAILFFVVLSLVFLILRNFTKTWVALVFSLAVSVSPLSLYVSMFLPEMFFFVGVTTLLFAVLRASQADNVQEWFAVGLVTGVISLIKPHAWLSFIAVIIFFLVSAFSQWHSLKPFIAKFAAIIFGAVAGRVVVGLLVGGPKALDFFGQYFSLDLLSSLLGLNEPVQAQTEISTGATVSPVDAVFQLFSTQLWVHVGTVLALSAPAVAILLSRALALIKERTNRERSLEASLGVFVLVWLGVMVIEIVAFTGWITGSGDDHTTRVLLRYYEFLLVFVPMAALSTMWSKSKWAEAAWVRWLPALTIIYGMSVASLGLFSTLTIQIADAPSLAGYVVNRDVFSAISIFFFIAMLSFAVFPKLSKFPVLATTVMALALTGSQTFGQYQSFRGEPQPSDLLGSELSSIVNDVSPTSLIIVGDSRFNATAAAFVADRREIQYLLASSQDFLPEGFQKNATVIGSLIPLNLDGFTITAEGDGYWIYTRE